MAKKKKVSPLTLVQKKTAKKKSSKKNKAKKRPTKKAGKKKPKKATAKPTYDDTPVRDEDEEIAAYYRLRAQVEHEMSHEGAVDREVQRRMDAPPC